MLCNSNLNSNFDTKPNKIYIQVIQQIDHSKSDCITKISNKKNNTFTFLYFDFLYTFCDLPNNCFQ